jgi:hypothetical protein
MPDQSHLDRRYFVDQNVYNCPFCNRRNVAYSIYNQVTFDWTDRKPCYCYYVQCHSCGKHSMHLSFQALKVDTISISGGHRWKFSFTQGIDAGEMLDRAFFYSVPTSFFVLDERVPRILRELLTEAEGCLKSNYLTGASACARKIIYELGVLRKATGDNYEDRIKSLKKRHSEVEPEFFDTLLTIQQVTSSKVHENSYDKWEAQHLRIILAALADVLHEIYVVPALREDRRKAILALKEELVPPRC